MYRSSLRLISHFITLTQQPWKAVSTKKKAPLHEPLGTFLNNDPPLLLLFPLREETVHFSFYLDFFRFDTIPQRANLLWVI